MGNLDKKPTQTSPPLHTPGHLWIDDDGYIAAGTGDGYISVAEIFLGDSVAPENALTLKVNTARLFSAGYNAFDSAARKLRMNTVDLAERMQDGGIAALVSNLERSTFLLRRIAEGDHRALENARKAADDADAQLATVREARNER